MYIRFVFFIALIICKRKCIAEYSLYERNFDQGKKNEIYRHRSVFQDVLSNCGDRFRCSGPDDQIKILFIMGIVQF